MGFSRLHFCGMLAFLFAMVSPGGAIRIGKEDRSTFEEFRMLHQLSENQIQELFGASLRVVCPWGVAGASLVTREGAFVSVDHIFFGKEAKREPLKKCFVETLFGKKRLEIDPRHYYRGRDIRREASVNEQDIFVGRLLLKSLDILPYRVGRTKVTGEQVISVSQGQINWKGKRYPTPSVGQCTILSTTALSMFSDCDSDKGSSGASLLDFSLGEPPRLVGVGTWTYYGDRGPYSSRDCDDTTKCATQHLSIGVDIIEKISAASSQ